MSTEPAPKGDMWIGSGDDSHHSKEDALNDREFERAAEAATGIDADTVYPHCLRASCASHFASKGIDVVSLKSLMGWSDYQAAENYLAESGKRTEKALRKL